MTIRRTLILSLVGLMLGAAALVSYLGAQGIQRSVLTEVQDRVSRALTLATSLFEERRDAHVADFQERTKDLALDDPSLDARLWRVRDIVGLTVLNICDPDGRPIAGAYPSRDARVPVVTDPILRRALLGETAVGVVRLSPERLALEGGTALQKAMETHGPVGELATADALFWWFAAPFFSEDGRVVAVRYGGVALNGNHMLVDALRALAFGNERYEGKPHGTVTIFLDDTRVATNVLGPAGTRALGTRVSDEVADSVLRQGRVWNDRAWVVDAWYRSGYRPLASPDGEVVGMLYVGLLETPYADQESELIRSFIIGLTGVFVAAFIVLLLVVGGITRPLHRLASAARRLAEGSTDVRPTAPSRFEEIRHFQRTFREMQEAIEERDRHLHERNEELVEANKALEKANRSYMEMLGFVTHELKAPMAAVHMMVTSVLDGYMGEVPEHLRPPLGRIRRNCEGLQDMVKNYLDLSRVERGELAATMRTVDLANELFAVCADQTAALFTSRSMKLEIDCPEGLAIRGDPELLRIAVSNFLTNAAKYGKEGGAARLSAERRDDGVVLSVWNEGPGFTAVERERLFQKFSRLDNSTTRAMRGSGVGLFLVRQIVDLHEGSVDASSVPGEWARFDILLPETAADGAA